MRCYAAGPISGLTKGQSDNWRYQFEEMIAPHKLIYPMHAEKFDKDRVLGTCHPGELMASAKAVAHKDEFYVRQCDAVVANFMGSGLRPSFGTVIECAWAILLNKPLIIVGERDNIHKHPMICEKAGWIVEDLRDAATVINGLFGAIN